MHPGPCRAERRHRRGLRAPGDRKGSGPDGRDRQTRRRGLGREGRGGHFKGEPAGSRAGLHAQHGPRDLPAREDVPGKRHQLYAGGRILLRPVQDRPRAGKAARRDRKTHGSHLSRLRLGGGVAVPAHGAERARQQGEPRHAGLQRPIKRLRRGVPRGLRLRPAQRPVGHAAPGRLSLAVLLGAAHDGGEVRPDGRKLPAGERLRGGLAGHRRGAPERAHSQGHPVRLHQPRHSDHEGRRGAVGAVPL